jgi:hypothetical protein
MARRFCIAALLFGCALPAHAQDAAKIDFFEKKIRPVLVESCYSCHSTQAKKTRGGLKLDTRDAVMKGGDTGPALIPGKSQDSLLIKAIRYDDLDLKMPPKGKLSAEVVRDFEKWIDMGAPDPRTGKEVAGKSDWDTKKDFWVYKPPVKKAIPAVKDQAWPSNDIDRILLAKLESKGLRPAADADRATLLRRTYFALVGVPPTPAQLDAFVNDKSQDAFVKVVDKLLDSKQFGERWGRFWLDIARYADSTGGGRSLLFKDAWRYRDYVIKAFNEDKPFDRFILEQIAGDLLEAKTPDERRELLVATAFILLGAINYEEQDKPMLEMDIVDEQLDTIGRSFLGMTMGCARCHDHKFDPIPTRDYYAMAGILRSTKVVVHSNVSAWNEVNLPVMGTEAEVLKKQDEKIAVLKAEITKVKAAEAKAGKSTTVALKGPIDPTSLPGIVIDDSEAKVIGPWKHSTFSGHFVGKGYLYDDRGAKVDKTVTFQPEIPKTGFYEVRLAYVPYKNRATNVPVRIFHTDGDDTVHVNQQKEPDIDGCFVSLGKYRFAKGSQWFVMVSTEGANGHVTADAVQFLPEEPVEVVKEEPVSKTRTAKQLEDQLKRVIASGPQRPKAMATEEKEKIEDCHICIRGNFHNKGAMAPRGFLSVVPLSADPKFKIGPKESGRKQLAEWLASPQNPLTARVTVNRLWHHLFGEGIVRTVDNFGTTGELPANQELLDHLAIRFVENGWSIKKMVREIMLSHAYRVSSTASDEAAKLDPENRMVSHQTRRRLDAEAIRDSILAISGTLDPAMFGPTMKKGIAIERDHVFEDTRRSVYTPILRNKLLELFEVFDFANPNVCTGRRNTSTVPTQSLYFMNSPFIMDQAKAAAAKTLKTSGLDDAGRLTAAYRSALGRSPTEHERQLVLEFLSQTPEAERAKAWEGVYQSLFGCIDFRYVN